MGAPAAAGKGFEEMLQERFRHPDARVPDRETVTAASLRPERRYLLHLEIHLSALRREFDGVAQKIDQDLVDPQRVPIKIRVTDRGAVQDEVQSAACA